MPTCAEADACSGANRRMRRPRLASFLPFWKHNVYEVKPETLICIFHIAYPVNSMLPFWFQMFPLPGAQIDVKHRG